jgi:hypothetical protein
MWDLTQFIIVVDESIIRHDIVEGSNFRSHTCEDLISRNKFLFYFYFLRGHIRDALFNFTELN